MRITISDLRNAVTEYNGYLEECGSNKRLREQGRNGYQAVDIYTLDEDNPDSEFKPGCNNLTCGSSRECISAISDFYGSEYRKIEKAKTEKLVEFATTVKDILTVPGAKVSAIRKAAKRLEIV